MMKTVNIRGLYFADTTLEEAAVHFADLAESDGAHAVFTPNAEIVQYVIEHPGDKPIFDEAAMLLPDGAGVILASRILGRRIGGRVTGVDLAGAVLPLLAERGLKLYLFGGKPGVAEKAAEEMVRRAPGLQICGLRDGYFKDEENEAVCRQIAGAAPDVIFVCLGSPRQEKWIASFKDRLPAHVLIGLGGTLDIFAGTATRAPAGMRKLGLEWLYRLMRQPSRIGRMMKLPKFVFGTVWYKISGKCRRESTPARMG